MRNRLLLSLLMGMMALLGFAQSEPTILENLTSRITNADFMADEPVTVTIRTYDYDMPDGLGLGNGGTDRFGQQEVTGWVATTPTDNIWMAKDARTDGANACAAGVYAYTDPEAIEYPGLGGEYYPPFAGDGNEGNALGLVAVWGHNLQYTQDITLPAGGYMLLVKIYNAAGAGDVSANNFGFFTEGKNFVSTRANYPVDEWVEDAIYFQLTEETAGQLSLGFAFGAGSGSAPHLFVDNVALYSIDESYFTQIAIDELKESLWALIEKASGVDVDTEEAQAVYDNPSATLAQVQEAIEKLQAKIDASMTDLSEFFIRNPKFSEGEPIVGGICTYDYDMPKNSVEYYGSQPIKGWTGLLESNNVQIMSDSNDNSNEHPENGRASGIFAIGSGAWLGGSAYVVPNTLSNGSTDGNLLGMVTCWSQSVQYKQNLTLPAGKYTIIMSYYNTGGANAVAKNLIGFVEENGTEHLGAKTQFPVGSWSQDQVAFELEEETAGYFTLGYQSTGTGSANMPHLFVDGFSLYYVGTGFDPSLFALQAAVSAGNKIDTDAYNADLRDQLANALATGEQLLDDKSTDSEANLAATNAINLLLDQVRSSIAAYERLLKFYDEDLSDALETYDAENYFALNEELSNLQGDVEDALGDYNWTDAQIDATIASLTTILRTHIKILWDAAVESGETLTKDLDITALFDQMAYTYSTTAVKNTSVPDKEWKYGDANEFKTQYGTAEVWNQSPFQVKRTLTDMPAGKYTLTTKAFYRTADNPTNMINYDPEEELAYIFAGKTKTAIVNLAELARDEQPEGVGEWVAANGDDMAPYVPNNQFAAYNIFNDDAYAEIVTRSVSTVLTETGDLVFGAGADVLEPNSWVLWYGFDLTYNAIDDDAIDNEIQGYMDEAEAILNAGELYVTEADNKLNTALGSGEEALDDDSRDVKLTALQGLKDALKYAEESTELCNEFSTARDEFIGFTSKYLYDASDTEIDGLLDKNFFADNAEVRTTIDRLPIAWFNYVLSQNLTGASLENGIDITGAILNPDFEIGSSKYWTLTEGIGQNQGYQGASYSNEGEGIEVNKFIEAWFESTAEVLDSLENGTIGQELVGILPAGYYTLAADAYSVNQGAEPEDGVHGCYLMATNGTSTWRTDIGIEGTSGMPLNFSVDFYSDGVTPITVGLQVYNTNANWMAADNFTLYYIGTVAPDAIEGVEAAKTATPAAIYNIAGQRVVKAVKGLYIINGKKVMVK